METSIDEEWRTRLLGDVLKGSEGARLRRLIRSKSRGAKDQSDCAPRRFDRDVLLFASRRARAVGTLRALHAVRGVAPDGVARCEERIRFALDRVDEARYPAFGPLRMDRLVIALQILDGQVYRAAAFIALVASGIGLDDGRLRLAPIGRRAS